MTNSTTPVDMQWLDRALGNSLQTPWQWPFTWQLGDRVIRGVPQDFAPVITQQQPDANLVLITCTGTDANGLQVCAQATVYRDYPVAEWLVTLRNTGTQDTPVIRRLAMECTLPVPQPQLYHNNGDFCDATGLQTTITPLQAGQPFTLYPRGGRSCDGALPYMRVVGPQGGYNLAIGWPGQWLASFTARDGSVAVQAQQQYFCTYLKPGEQVRSPRMTLMGFEGDAVRAANLWRRFMFAHILPRQNGRPVRPMSFASENLGGEEFTLAAEDNQVQAIERFKQHHFDAEGWWIDAGWYPCMDEQGQRHWWYTGTWQPDPQRFANGFGPVSRACQQAGMQLLVWFEPERINKPYWPADLPAEYVLSLTHPNTPDERNRGMLNLGNPQCRQWMTQTLLDLIAQGIGIYRQDFNFEPLQFWLDNDGGADRLGICENLHTQGYLQMWDDLRAANPDLLIDSCASGGRRNDLEAMRRAVALHPTDYGYGEHPVKQAFAHTWFEWTPYFRGIALSWDDDQGNYPSGEGAVYPERGLENFGFHNALAPALSLPLSSQADEATMAQAKVYLALWRRAADYLLQGDYYRLLPVERRADAFAAMQFHDPQTQTGLVQVIANNRCRQPQVTLQLQQIDPEGVYFFESPEFDRSQTLTGQQLCREGFVVQLPLRTGEIWFYRRVEQNP